MNPFNLNSGFNLEGNQYVNEQNNDPYFNEYDNYGEYDDVIARQAMNDPGQLPSHQWEDLNQPVFGEGFRYPNQSPQEGGYSQYPGLPLPGGGQGQYPAGPPLPGGGYGQYPGPPPLGGGHGQYPGPPPGGGHGPYPGPPPGGGHGQYPGPPPGGGHGPYPGPPQGGGHGQYPGPPPHGGHGQDHHDGPPTAAPPLFVPQLSGGLLKAVDPGSLRGCLYRNTYIWLESGRGFWFYPTYVGRYSVAGYRWRRNLQRWVYFGVDADQIRSFQCY
ncbi:hypothetical protein [Peribacillus loiseleuriae]|uniref:hypothetical protein n=1 Tax=Peribacillus loiseleuriae TaxID=1679170 RepID=UPI000A5BE662|nr:hypothetical protein [Peribacillus loiseleuriae]